MNLAAAGVDDPTLESSTVVTAKSNYVGVNSAHAATCFVHQRRHREPNVPILLPEQNEGVFGEINNPMELKRITDGLSNTLMIGERAWQYRAEGKTYKAYAATSIMNGEALLQAGNFGQGDSDTCGAVNNGRGINFPHEIPAQAMNTFSSNHPQGAEFALVDGSVHFIVETIDADVLVNLARVRDGRVVGEY